MRSNRAEIYVDSAELSWSLGQINSDAISVRGSC
jgi:hypothetical protein